MTPEQKRIIRSLEQDMTMWEVILDHALKGVQTGLAQVGINVAIKMPERMEDDIGTLRARIMNKIDMLTKGN